MFWRPSYLEASPWLEHIPLAFWIIEASQPKLFVEVGAGCGASYFAHCQAIDKLGLDTQGFAIDTWGENDSNKQVGNSVFEKINAYNESQYSGFSNLLRSSMDGAAHYFADGSIDLLHISGLNALGFSLRDFEVWLPKLSDRAIVLLHGTNARDRTIGIFKLYETLQTRYPSFEFSFGQGLGLIGVGNNQNEVVQLLLDTNQNERAKQAIHEVFFRLGRACADSLSVIKHKENIQNLNEALDKQNSQLAEIQHAFETTQTELLNQGAELNETKNMMGVQIEQHAIERGQLSEKITMLQEIRSDLKKEVDKWQLRTDSTAADLHARIEEMARLQQSNHSHRQQIENVANQLQMQEADISTLQNERLAKQGEIDALREELTTRNSELDQLQNSKQMLADENMQLNSANAALAQEIVGHQQHTTTLQESEGVKQTEIEALRQELTARNSELDQLQNSKQVLADENMQLNSANAALAQEIVGHQQHSTAQQESNRAKQAEIEALHVELTTRNSELDQLQNNKQVLADENEEFKQTISTLEQEVRDHRCHVGVMQEKLHDKENAVAQLLEKTDALTKEQALRFDELAELTRNLMTLEQSNEDLNAELLTLREKSNGILVEKESLGLKLVTRFEELAYITRILMQHETMLGQKSQRLLILQKQALRWKNDSAWKQPMRMPFRKADKYQKQVEQIQLSGLFDTEWYLKQYPDVAMTGKNPVVHYLRFGATENRDPSPIFCTAAYRDAHQEALAGDTNPLLHFIETEAQRISETNMHINVSNSIL